jgi:hypothetical protein
MRPRREELFTKWNEAADRERRSRTIFAQESFKLDEVKRELDAVRAAIGTVPDVARFTEDVLRAYGAAVTRQDGEIEVDLREVPRAVREIVGQPTDMLRARFEKPVRPGTVYLPRTHPIVEGLAAQVLDTSMDPAAEAIARRAGAIRTAAVSRRTTLLLLRFRFHIRWQQGVVDHQILAEDAGLLAFAGSATDPAWLDAAGAEDLLAAAPMGNVAPEEARAFVGAVIDHVDQLQGRLSDEAASRAEQLLEAHRRVRAAARLATASVRVEPELPLDVLGVFVFLPATKTTHAA